MKSVINKSIKPVSVIAAVIALLMVFAFMSAAHATEPENTVTSSKPENAATSTKPKKVKHVNVTSAKEGQLTVTWAERECTGYQVQIAKNKKFTKGKKTIKITKRTTVSKTVTGLTKGKLYYVRVRAYNKTAAGTDNGKWSKVRSVTIHKHKYTGKITKKPTWTEYGVKTYTCSCGESYTKASGKPYCKSYKIEITLSPTCETGLMKLGPDNWTLPAAHGHTPIVVGNKIVCSECGLTLNNITHDMQDITGAEYTTDFTAPKKTRGKETFTASMTNTQGYTYNYKLYYQKSDGLAYKYTKYHDYLDMHGCSTCALTTILNATVPSLADMLPDEIIEKVIKNVAGSTVFDANFSKSLSSQMPIGLKGMSAVLDAYGVENKYVYTYDTASAAAEIRKHLANGDPVIFTIPKSTYAGGVHTMLMLGLDDNGRVIVGDSLYQASSKWGSNNGLIKFNTTSSSTSSKVEKICKYFDASTTKIDNVGFFYNGRKGNIGYILVYGSGSEGQIEPYVPEPIDPDPDQPDPNQPDPTTAK